MHNRVQVGVSAPGDEVSSEPIFEFCVRSLGTERLGVHCGSKLGFSGESVGYGWRNAELDQPQGGNKLNQMRELIVKVGDSQFCPPTEKALFKASVVGPGALGSNGSNVKLRNELRSIAECLKQAEQRGAGIRDAGLLDARSEIGAKLRPAEKSGRIGAQQVVRKRCPRRCFHAKDCVFLDATAQRVIKTVCETACYLQGVAVVAAISRTQAKTRLGEAAFRFVAKPKQSRQLRFHLVFSLGVNKITIGAG